MELAGLVLGGFSLVISAMEHYEAMEKMGRTWWKVKREYKRDLGRLRDCQLMYRAHTRTLLAPLELDGTIDSSQLEMLLTNLESKVWQQSDIDKVISKRLGERKERYFDNLREMNDTIVKLGKASRALDKDFQASLERDTQKKCDPATDAAHSAMLRANSHIKFELKRTTYTLTTYKREALLNDIERCNNTLKDFLSIQDGVQDDGFAPQPIARGIIPRYYKTLLTFWRHAVHIHRLMRTAWRCSCSSVHCVNIQLDPRSFTTNVCMDMIVRFCDSKVVQQTRLWEKLSLSVSHYQYQTGSSYCGQPLRINFNLPNFTAQPSSNGPGPTNPKTPLPSLSPGLQGIPANSSESLCLLAQKGEALGPGACVCTLADDTTDFTYDFFRAVSSVDTDEAHSLSDILSRSCPIELLYMHRLVLAYNIAHAFLRFGATPWLDGTAMSKALYLPIAPGGQSLLHKQAFVLSHFHLTPTPQLDDITFQKLGILLLELCFNKTLEQHPQWQSWQQIPTLVADPVLRFAVATTWARTVEDVWSVEGAQAINWCLHIARAQNHKWREEFAANVVEPLRTLCKNAGQDVDKRQG